MNSKIVLGDHWLETLGYFRMKLPINENCLFQAVSYQLFSSHLFHENVRDFCLSYVTKNSEAFMNMFVNLNCWESYLSKLKNHTNTCNLVELYMISFTYQRRILLFDGLSRTVETIGSQNYIGELQLCYMGHHHYDAISKFMSVTVGDQMFSETLNLLISPETSSNASNTLNNERRIQSDLLDTARAPEPISNFRRNSLQTNIRGLEKELLGMACVIEGENGAVLDGFISKVLDEEACLVYIPSRQENRKISIRHLHPFNNVNSLPPSDRYTLEKKEHNRRRTHTPSPIQSNNNNSYNRNTGPTTSNSNQQFGVNLRMPSMENVFNDNTATPAYTGVDTTFPMSTPNFYPFRQPEVNVNNPTQQIPWSTMDYPPVINETIIRENQGFSNQAFAGPVLQTLSPSQSEMDPPSVMLQSDRVVIINHYASIVSNIYN